MTLPDMWPLLTDERFFNWLFSIVGFLLPVAVVSVAIGLAGYALQQFFRGLGIGRVDDSAPMSAGYHLRPSAASYSGGKWRYQYRFEADPDEEGRTPDLDPEFDVPFGG